MNALSWTANQSAARARDDDDLIRIHLSRLKSLIIDGFAVGWFSERWDVLRSFRVIERS
jgi:hypothetical protein